MTLNRMFASVLIASASLVITASPAMASPDQGMISWVDPATGEAWLSQEDCPNAGCYQVPSVNLTDVDGIDSLDDCAEEDGSGSASLPCVWVNDGNAWITYSDHSVLVIDDTVS